MNYARTTWLKDIVPMKQGADSHMEDQNSELEMLINPQNCIGLENAEYFSRKENASSANAVTSVTA